MHLTLETQRDTRTGGVAETLDIKISDELGTRNYELFSGGEAFASISPCVYPSPKCWRGGLAPGYARW